MFERIKKFFSRKKEHQLIQENDLLMEDRFMMEVMRTCLKSGKPVYCSRDDDGKATIKILDNK